MVSAIPSWSDSAQYAKLSKRTSPGDVTTAMSSSEPGLHEFAALISPAASNSIEAMAQRAQQITGHHFGKTISLYVPLYISNHCPGGCSYCGFASDRELPRRKLGEQELDAELATLKNAGFEDVLLLTGERTEEADFDYLHAAVSRAAKVFHSITVESFSMTVDEYRNLADVGCTGITLYQETYDPELYRELHRWGPKQDFSSRLEAPARALAAGLRTVGMGVLLGLADPVRDSISLFQHVEGLRRQYWQAGVTISFPRICSQLGGYAPAQEVDDRSLAQLIFAFRICLKDVPLVLSTRERPGFRDGMAGLGITRMSVASRTTVGGYHTKRKEDSGQFKINDERDVEAFCETLRKKGLEPVFKNWDAVFHDAEVLT